jgi:hypothetical protein
MQRTLILLLACSLAAAASTAAQTGTPGPPATLDARMQAFLREVEETPNTALAAYFPRRGDWTWVQTRREFRGDATGTGIWRFPGAETARAIGEGGPVCDSFHAGDGEFGPVAGRLANYVEPDDGRWRRTRGTRYVPPGAPAGSPVFVEWRREDGEWVVSAVGDEAVSFSPPLRGRAAGEASRDTSLVPEGAAYAAGQAWYQERQPIYVQGRRYIPYGVPRTIDRADLQRVAVLGRVSVYAERGATREEVLYFPTSPGEYQAYQTFGPEPCR